MDRPDGGGLTPSAGRIRRRHGLAGLASLAFHALISVLMFGTASGDLVSGDTGGGDEGQVFTVTLVSPLPSMPAPSPAAVEQARFKPLFAKVQMASDKPVPVLEGRPSGAFAALEARLRTSAPSPDARSRRFNEPQPQLTPANTQAQASSKGAVGAQAEAGTTVAASGSAGNLWGRISPCWRNMSSRGRTPIIIDVTLDARGQLALPPKILRDARSDMDRQQLRAEDQALAALAACLPHNDVSFGGRTHRLVFPIPE